MSTTNTGDELDRLFYQELRGKTVTQEQKIILAWAEERLKPAVQALIAQKFIEAQYQELKTWIKFNGANKPILALMVKRLAELNNQLNQGEKDE